MKTLYLSITAAALVILSCKNDTTPETISDEVNNTITEEPSEKTKNYSYRGEFWSSRIPNDFRKICKRYCCHN